MKAKLESAYSFMLKYPKITVFKVWNSMYVWVFCRLCDLRNECEQLKKEHQHPLMNNLCSKCEQLKIENEPLEKKVEEDKATKTRTKTDWKT